MKLTHRIAFGLALAGLAGCAPASGDGKTTTSSTPAAADPSKTSDTKDPSKQQDQAGADESKPADSTGVSAAASLNFGSAAAIALWLEETTEAAPTTTEAPVTTMPAATTAAKTLTISDAITVDFAEASIAAVKLKPAKDPTDADKKIDEADAADDAAEAADLAATAGDDAPAAALTSKPAVKQSLDDRKAKLAAKMDERKAKLAAKKADLKAKLAEHAGKAKGRDKAMKFAGPYVYDFVAGALVGDAPKVDVNDGSYRRIEFKLRPNFDVADSDKLFGQALVVTGSFKNGDADAVPFAVEVHNAMNLRIAGDAGAQVAAGAENKLGVVFDLKAWFEGVDLAAAEVDEETGTILIDNKHNKDIFQAFRKNVKTKSSFGKDKDGDGKIAADETTGTGEDVPDAAE
jgi:hypothetical protein